MKYILFLIIGVFINNFSNAQNKLSEISVLTGIVDTSYYSQNSKIYKIHDIDAIKGNYLSDTITLKVFIPSAIAFKGDKVFVETLKSDYGYIVYEDLNCISPIGNFTIIDHTLLNQINISSYDSLISGMKDFFLELYINNDEQRIKNLLNIAKDKKEKMIYRMASIDCLNNPYFLNSICFPSQYINFIRNELYTDTVLDIKLRAIVRNQMGGGSFESSLKCYNYDVEQEVYYFKKTKSNLEYFIPLWKKGILFCDSMINTYEAIIKDVPYVKDTISLADDSNLFFTGKIKKVNNNELLISNPKFFTGEYLKDKITVKADIDTLFEKTIEGESVLVQASLVNDKYIINLSDQNGFNKPALTPDGTNLYILSKDNLLKNSIKIKPDELLDVISKYYSDLNSEIITKDQKLVNYINKGKYLFIRQRSLWEFSDLTLEYDSLCWDYNRKYILLDSLINTFGRYKAPPLSIIVTADLLFTRSFNQNYSSKYITNIYELDHSRNVAPILRYQEFMKLGDLYAKKYAIMRFQDIINYYQNIKKVLTHRLIVYEN